MIGRQVTFMSAAAADDDEASQPKTFESALKYSNLILLGDPGAGKSHLFESASKHESGELYTARGFLIYGESSTSDTIYIDALDE